MSKNIFVLGSLNMDLCIESPYVPKKGETVTGNGFFTNCGGKGANQAVAASKLGGKVFMCGAVGNDSFGDRLVNELYNAGVDINCVKRIENVSTGIAMIILSQGDNRIILDKGANYFISEHDVDEFLASAKSGDIFLTQLENPIEIAGYGLKIAKERGMYTILNPAPANVKVIPYMKYVDLITPNETEIEIFGGREKLIEYGCRKIITTLGSKGYEITTENKSIVYSCIKVTVIDTTAAGDTFCGGLSAGLSNDMTLENACDFGSKAASIACTKKGALQSIPDKETVLKYKQCK